MDENDLLYVFIQRVPFDMPDVRVFRRNIVNLPTTIDDRTFRARSGVKGQADAYALTKGGFHVEIETKAARGEMREAQLAWRQFCLEWAIPHLVLKAKRGEEPDTTVKRWVEELREAVYRS